MFLAEEERDAAQILSDAFARDGIEIYLNTEAVCVRVEGVQTFADLIQEGTENTVVADKLLVGVGQTPNVEKLNLEAGNVEYDPAAGIHVNDFLQTTNPNIYPPGDMSAKRKSP